MNEQIKTFLQPVSWIRTIVIIIICGLIAWKLFFQRTETTHITMKPGSTYIDNTKKGSDGNWEAGLFGGMLELDRKSGAFAGVEIKRKF